MVGRTYARQARRPTRVTADAPSKATLLGPPARRVERSDSVPSSPSWRLDCVLRLADSPRLREVTTVWPDGQTTIHPSAETPLLTTIPLAAPSTPADSDERLVSRAVAGEIEAFEILVQRYRQIAVRVATRIVGREEAEDVAQDAFLRAYHRLDRFRREAPFRSWLLRIVHNTAINAATRRVPTPVEELPIDADPDIGGERTPARYLEDLERRRR